ncbi:band-7-like membrane protein [Mycobacterium phage Riparian]|uniref:Band 7 domain-containing protein n=4 Tax=Papyrusvirus send513 TaxID=1982556 RepID=A0A1Z1LWW2_9CAUD|nr:hypothetical protein SEA_ZENON_80 [Mycobacterium phage Zenon]AYQ98652.1 band-7-like membrane protein [Mycobacterium phage Riparian]
MKNQMWATLWLAFVLLVTIGFAVWFLFFPITKEREVSYGRYEKRTFRNPAALIGLGTSALVFLISLVLACTTIVGTRQVGIVTQWNRPTGETLSNGLHFILPWTSVHEMDAAIQNDVYNGDHRIQVRLGNNSTAMADVNVRWEIKPDQADELFQQYKTFDNVRSNLVERNLRTVLNEAFMAFDPLAGDPKPPVGPDGKPTGPAPKPVTLSSVTADALAQLQAKSDQVTILDLSVPVIDYDDNTEQKINAINAARADTTRAEQEAKTAEQKRLAAEELAKQPIPDLRIAIAACVNKMAETGQTLNCFPLGNNVVPTLQVPNPAAP